MIWNFLYPLMLFGAVVVLPVWVWRRMKKVQRMTREALDEAPAMRRAERWEEVETGVDGSATGRAASYDPLLTAADRDRNDGGDNAILGDRR